MYVSLFRVRTEWYRILRKGSIFYLDKTLPTRLKCLKIQKGCVVCIICRFHKIEQCFNYINAKFQVVEFHYRSLFPRFRPIIFILGHLLVQVTWWFLASDINEIQASVKDFRPFNQNFTLNICYLLFYTLLKIKFSVFVVCGLVIFQYTNYCLYTQLYMYTGEYSCILSISYWLLHIDIKSKTSDQDDKKWKINKWKRVQFGSSQFQPFFPQMSCSQILTLSCRAWLKRGAWLKYHHWNSMVIDN